VKPVDELCAVVDRAQTRIVGIDVPVSFESQGYPGGSDFSAGTMNDYFIAKKYIGNGTMGHLSRALGLSLADSQIVSVRSDMHGDGNYRVLVGLMVEEGTVLPEFLPEHTAAMTLPARRYARIRINEQGRPGRIGYDERMKDDEYFIGAFREDTGYVYRADGYPMNTWDATGDLLTKYEPIRHPKEGSDRFDSLEFTPVLLPPWKIACRRRPHGPQEGMCIPDYFSVAPSVFATGLARYDQNGDFYGFPVDWEGSYQSCFGSRVSSFEGLPDTVEQVTLPGGKYVHITQKEFNGDNPSMLYDAAFHHMDTLYFSRHPNQEFDHGRKVIARFRQANCASVFVPVTDKA
jgi:hypothetical protein